jgi:HD-GYP domain-containing protein (c-di-GMP phosphodiesterase class II)
MGRKTRAGTDGRSEEGRDALGAPVGVAPPTARCRAALQDAVAALAGEAGAIFVVAESGAFEALVAHVADLEGLWGTTAQGAGNGAAADGTPVPAMMERAAREALRHGGPFTGPLDLTAVAGAGERGFFAAPLELDGDLAGVLVISGRGLAGSEPSACVRRLGPLLDNLALRADRLAILGALNKREEEVMALYSQLTAYAADFRSTYSAERARARQLAKAVDELARTYRATVRGLAMAVEAKDERTAGHLHRVSRYGMMVTGLVAPEHADDPQFEYGFLLHDVGKLTVPDGVLTKEGPLNDDEWELMRDHPMSGWNILEGIDFLDGARQIVYSHHERWDGNGYPRGLKGMEIPLGARIFPLCDAFDAMTSDRPYRCALPVDEAVSRVAAASGTQFWPDAVDAFMSLSRSSLEEVMHSGWH